MGRHIAAGVAVSGLAVLGLLVAGSGLATVWGAAGLGLAVFAAIALTVGAIDRYSRRAYRPLPYGAIPVQRTAAEAVTERVAAAK